MILVISPKIRLKVEDEKMSTQFNFKNSMSPVRFTTMEIGG
jgi:hypothetical protein